MSNNFINQETCKKCKLCIAACPVKMIGVNDNRLVNFISERESICLECGQCMAVCPNDAIKIKKYTYEDNFFKLPENIIDFQQFTNFITTRRSIRNFRQKIVPKEIIDQILSTLNYASYGAEPNKVKITVISNRQIIGKALPKIEEFLDDIVKWIENPVASFMIKHKKGTEIFNTIKNHLYPMAKLENYKLKYGDRITRDAPVMLIFHAPKGAEEHTIIL